MDRSTLRLLKACIAGAVSIPPLCVLCSQLSFGLGFTPGFLALFGITGAGSLLALLISLRILRRHGEALDRAAQRQAEAVDRWPRQWVRPAIFAAAAVSLLFELVMIRWQGTVFKFFDIYKNIGLLSCFVGLGLGYALARRGSLPLFLVLPLFCLQAGLMMILKHALSWRAEVFLANPVKEQLQMGLPLAQNLSQYVAIYSFMAVIFLLTALTFVPVGQLCGRVMQRRETLDAYGWNLLGSFAGVLLAFLVAALWTPPVVWFAVVFLGLLAFQGFSGHQVLFGSAFALVAVMLLSIPLPVGWEKVYSPYQLIERGPSRAASMDGLSTLTVSGKYYQRILDLSEKHQSVAPEARQMAHHYDLPYRAHGAVKRVAVLGAGTGNDVAASLRAGVEHVDAIEIDPAILYFGRMYHPEQPYQDERVNAVVNDARSYLRATDATYDMIVYGLLDAQTLLSHGSSVRLDSFVYTVEGLREARDRLNPDGYLSLSFAVCSEGQGRKIFRMIEEAFDGRSPVCVRTDIGDVTFLIGNRGDPPDLARLDLATWKFSDATAAFADPSIEAVVSTDDWPFLYMQKRVYPVSYLMMLFIVPLLSFVLIGSLLRRDQRSGGGFGHLAFLFLGAGFMLVETKGITELGLTFGNTWHVIGVVIMGVLGMAYLANLVVERFGIRKWIVPYALLFIALLIGYLIARAGGLPSTTLGRLGTVVVLTCPLFFSGIVFSTLLANSGNVSAAMASNLLGAMLGGLLEYNSMYFGFRFLYLLGLALYGVALLLTLARPVRGADSAQELPQQIESG